MRENGVDWGLLGRHFILLHELIFRNKLLTLHYD